MLKRFDLEHITEVYDEFYPKMPTFFDEYKTEKFSNYYQLKKIIVLTSPRTYSSGYTMMKIFDEMGAALIGTPSSQNENTAGWILNFELKNSSLTGWVACKYYVAFTDRLKDGVYQIDYPITYDLLKEYNFDPNSELLFALDLLKKKF
ncbi:MAG: hypothetical protein FK733_00695 [Asgard group archaeon]|nr:hypothetical protein [Asgard group archaeon]